MTPTNDPLWDRWSEVDRLFEAALDRAPEDRDAFLAGACGTDTELLELLRSLLEHGASPARGLTGSHESLVRDILNERRGSEGRDTLLADAFEGLRLGPFELERMIGRGGLGVVYRARRVEGGFDQRVAIKLLRESEGAKVLRRFERERAILAYLDHPYIATLLDGGIAPDGRPYLVMEYVDGRPITRYSEEESLSIRGRLRLFLRVCDAVASAHARLVVHRDLKPSNILVTGDGSPKLLDFGIARILEAGGSEGPLQHTLTGALSPAYASPEQIRGDPVAIASDVFQLGTLLYLLLAGRRPHDEAETSPLTLIPLILEKDPPLPSEAVADAGVGGVARPRVRSALRGDLDTVIMKALRKEPDRRYGSVAELAEDLRRHLDGMPVRARPDSFGYRSSKFVRRNRAAVAGAALFVAALVGGLGAALWQRGIAVAEAARANEVSDFVMGLFEVTDPALASDEEVSLRDLLERGAARIEDELAGQPRLQADMYSLIGPIYTRLGLYDGAREMLSRAVDLRQAAGGTGSPGHALATHELARLEHRTGNRQAADSLYQLAGAWLAASRGPRSVAAARVQHDRARLASDQGLPATADSLYTAARELLAAGGVPAAELLLLDLDHLQQIHLMGDAARADSLYSRIIANRAHLDGERSLTLASGMLQIGLHAVYGGDAERAEPLIRGAVELRRQVHGEQHADVAHALAELAAVEARLGRHDESVATRRAAVAIFRESLGPEHPDYAMWLSAFGVTLSHVGDLDEAAAAFAEAERIQVEALGETSYMVGMTRRNFGRTLAMLGRSAEALPKLEAGLASWLADRGDDEFFTWQARLDIAGALAALGRREAADSLVDAVLARYRSDLPRGSTLAEALIVQARLRAGDGSLREAVRLTREALADLDERGIAQDDLARAPAESDLGGYLIDLGELAAAEPLLLHALETLEALRGPRNPEALAARERLARLYREWGRPDDAARVAAGPR
jgi:eukaryotic-like serine/threonine-protein kinase